VPLTAKQDEARREDGIHKHISAADLEEERRVPDEGDSGFTRLYKFSLPGLAFDWLLMALADEPPKLTDFCDYKWLPPPQLSHPTSMHTHT
jgi:hypothetical protein